MAIQTFKFNHYFFLLTLTMSDEERGSSWTMRARQEKEFKGSKSWWKGIQYSGDCIVKECASIDGTLQADMQ